MIISSIVGNDAVEARVTVNDTESTVAPIKVIKPMAGAAPELRPKRYELMMPEAAPEIPQATQTRLDEARKGTASSKWSAKINEKRKM